LNKKGISFKNVEITIEKIRKAIFMWEIHSLNMLERITIAKTFLLSKLWFKATFISLKTEIIKELNLMLFKYI